MTCSLLTCGSISFKPCQTFEEALFFFSHLINRLPIHSIKMNRQAHTHVPCVDIHTVCTHFSRLQYSWQVPSDRQAERSEGVNDGEGGSEKSDGGVRDNNQMTDRIQVFGFARQPLCCLHSLRQSMVSDCSTVLGRQS